MSEWQLIETAPKDETWILLCGGTIESWDGDTKPDMVVGQFVPEAKPQACWQFAWYDGGHYGEYWEPTHWQPLPEPPKIDA